MEANTKEKRYQVFLVFITLAARDIRNIYTCTLLFSYEFFMSASLIPVESRVNRPRSRYRKSIHDFTARICGNAWRNDKDNEAGPDMPMEPGEREETDQRGQCLTAGKLMTRPVYTHSVV